MSRYSGKYTLANNIGLNKYGTSGYDDVSAVVPMLK
jgi:hypothetical protein